MNVTAVPSGNLWFLTMWAGGLVRPKVSTLNSFDGDVVANTAIIPSNANSSITAFASVPGGATTDVVLHDELVHPALLDRVREGAEIRFVGTRGGDPGSKQVATSSPTS